MGVLSSHLLRSLRLKPAGSFFYSPLIHPSRACVGFSSSAEVRQLADEGGFALNNSTSKKLFRRLFLSAFTFVFIGLEICSAAPIISEVMTAAGSTSDEFVELYNPSATAYSLSGHSLRRKTQGDVTATGASLKTFGASDSIPAHGYYLWTNTGASMSSISDTTTGSSLTDNNSLALYQASTRLDSATWGTGHTSPYSPSVSLNLAPYTSLQRDLSTLSWVNQIVPNPTNKSGVSELIAPPLPPVILPGSGTVRISEIYADPQATGDAGEYVELHNYGSSDVDISGWRLKDASASAGYTFPIGTVLAAGGYRIFNSLPFALNNTDETLSLYEPAGGLIDTVAYDEALEEQSYNYAGGSYQWSPTLTPNTENVVPKQKSYSFDDLPTEGYVGVPLDFVYEAKRDSASIRWEFGDGKKSYVESTTHTYSKKGKYDVTLRVTDDAGTNITHHFTVKIVPFKVPKLRIVAFAPNPSGSDSTSEWIDIHNDGKRAVNIAGYIVATGESRLRVTPHRIVDPRTAVYKKYTTVTRQVLERGSKDGPVKLISREYREPSKTKRVIEQKELVIPAGETRRITRDHAVLSIPNQSGVVALLTPTEEVVDMYEYTNKKALPDGSTYTEVAPDVFRLTQTKEVEEISVAKEPAKETCVGSKEELEGLESTLATCLAQQSLLQNENRALTAREESHRTIFDHLENSVEDLGKTTVESVRSWWP